jgi:hypothetical protein
VTTWQSLASLGDQFLLAYAQCTTNTPVATLFNVGHAAELYLKALALQVNPSKSPSSYGHDVSSLLDLAHSEKLLLEYEVHSRVRDRIMKKWPHPIEAMHDPDFQSYVSHQELYWVAFYLGDVKYLGAKHLRAPETFGIMVMTRNPYWVSFFRQLRRHLNWPASGGSLDHVKSNRDARLLQGDADDYIQSLG